MCKMVIGCFAIILCALSIAAVQPAMAKPQAYVLVEGVDIDTVRSSFRDIMNCKARFGKIVRSEVIVLIECNELRDLNVAITNSVLQIEGGSRTTIWVMKSE